MPLSIGKSGSSKISSKNTFTTQGLGTVDSNHKEKMVEFQKRRKNLPQLEKKLQQMKEKYQKLKDEQENFDHLKEINQVEREITQIEKDIESIKDNKEEYEYLLNTGLLLTQYYEHMSNPMAEAKPKPTNVWSSATTITRTRPMPLRRSRSRSKPKSSRRPKRFQKPVVRKTNSAISNSQQMSRGEMLDEFKSLTDPNWVKKTECKNKKEESICHDCQVPKVLQYKESKYICPKCGIEEVTFIDSDRPSFKDPPPDANYFAYKRINHFNELLAQFQAKESTHIPKEVFDTIRKELKKERKTVKQLDFDLVKTYLKKHADKHYNQYYDHIFHIINRLNGDKPLNMTPEMENNLRYLFLQIQKPFDKFCPEERKNFISYNFVFYKFCKLLGYKEFLKYFPLLKSKDKLYEQEKIWQKIMTEIGLPYK